ncbi:helix-turn-helix transcriptional regulator [Chryseomicrobium sp. FSL W7-1435]|uniref:helix-turn-helix transcriptional regulator n=1 Tax=Chryseomicrobium sp. FSL W7-1435 TaxID=2921704 RepID=UPI003159EF48
MRQWLINQRKDLKMTQQQVADAAYINRAYYSQIESGKRTPSREVANKIAETLHFQPIAFFSEETDHPFRFALQNIPMFFAHCNLQLEYTWIYNPHPDFLEADILGKRNDELDLNQGISQLIQLKKDVLSRQVPIRRQIRFSVSTREINFWFFAEPLRNVEGELIGVVTAAIEVSNFEE